MLKLRRIDIERSEEVYKKIDYYPRFGIPVEPVGYTPEEFREMKMRKNAFIGEVLEKGKVMYSRA